ncbi:phasin family protein [Massilia niastensis]|uniref:phasin family protein n=1 Tax=Massilia niastensis TaxID=544911 RepID=UPI00039FD383|nr:phasin family protein [Massilia niastensis]
MFPFSQPVTPAARSHLDYQIAFFNDLSKSLSGSFQSLCQANLKLSQTVLEETMNASRRMLTTKHASGVFGAVTSGAQLASEKLRAYQQHLSRLAADVQVELASVTQQHGPETSRTAHASADEVTLVAEEDTDRNVRRKEETLKNFRDPFQKEGTQRGNGSAQAKANPQSVREGAGASIQFEGAHEGAGASMQFESLAENGSCHGKVQGPAAQPAQ